MAYSEVETLVFPDSMCLREGLYIELFDNSLVHGATFAQIVKRTVKI